MKHQLTISMIKSHSNLFIYVHINIKYIFQKLPNSHQFEFFSCFFFLDGLNVLVCPMHTYSLIFLTACLSLSLPIQMLNISSIYSRENQALRSELYPVLLCVRANLTFYCLPCFSFFFFFVVLLESYYCTH